MRGRIKGIMEERMKGRIVKMRARMVRVTRMAT